MGVSPNWALPMVPEVSDTFDLIVDFDDAQQTMTAAFPGKEPHVSFQRLAAP